MKALINFVAAVTLCGCAAVFHDTVNVEGRALKISLREEGGVIVKSFEVSINDQVVGSARRKSLAPGDWDFEPIDTQFGELLLKRKFEYAVANPKNYFEVYLDGEFAGTVMAPFN